MTHNAVGNRQRAPWGFLALFAAAALGGACLLRGPWDIVLSLWALHFVALGIAIVVLGAAIALGLRLLTLSGFRPEDVGARLALGAGLGLGAMSLLTLAVGLTGNLKTWLLWALVLAALMSGLQLVRALAREVASGVREAMARPTMVALLWGVVLVFFLLSLAGAFTPPHLYDVLEYHLAAPAVFHQEGKIDFIPGNVYASFPQNVEMLFLLGMCLDGTRDGGALVGQILVAGTALLTALALRCLGRRLFSGWAGDAAAVMFVAWPGTPFYASVAYVELPLVFYTTLTVLAASLVFGQEATPRQRSRGAALAGVCAGLAVGCKYTAALLLVLPVAAGLFFLLLPRVRVSGALSMLVIFLVAALVVVSPWLLKNYHYTGNPTYPLLYGVFGGRTWSAGQDARWTQAHAPPRGDDQPGFFVRTWQFLAMNEHSDILLLIFLPLALLTGGRQRVAIASLFGLIVVEMLLWFHFTHRVDRFLAPVVPLLALISGAGAGWASVQRYRLTGVALIILLFASPMRAINYAAFARSADLAMGWTSPRGFVTDPERSEFAHVYPAMEFINDSLPAEARVLFLGEARPYYCERRCEVATVFDRQWLEGAVQRSPTAAHLYSEFQRTRISHILVNTSELVRLQDTYRFRFQGREHLGMLDGFNWSLFGEFAQRHLRLVRVFAAPPGLDVERFDWAAWDKFLEWSVGEKIRRRGGYPGFVALYEVISGVHERPVVGAGFGYRQRKDLVQVEDEG